MTSTKTTNVARATYSLIFEKFKKTHFKFPKNLKLISGMNNVEATNVQNFNSKYLIILAVQK
jgi:hypothetical protein